MAREEVLGSTGSFILTSRTDLLRPSSEEDGLAGALPLELPDSPVLPTGEALDQVGGCMLLLLPGLCCRVVHAATKGHDAPWAHKPAGPGLGWPHHACVTGEPAKTHADWQMPGSATE